MLIFIKDNLNQFILISRINNKFFIRGYIIVIAGYLILTNKCLDNFSVKVVNL